MIWIGNTVTAHRRKGHHPQPRWKIKTVGGKKIKTVDRWVCDCGATLRP